jgi:hypothetical protein
MARIVRHENDDDRGRIERAPLDAHGWVRENGEMNDKTPRDWYNAHIGQRSHATDWWLREYWPDYFDDGPPTYDEPWKIVPPGLDHVIPQHLRLDGRVPGIPPWNR